LGLAGVGCGGRRDGDDLYDLPEGHFLTFFQRKKIKLRVFSISNIFSGAFYKKFKKNVCK